MCFLWGFQDSAVNTHSQEILGFEFDNNSEPFSVYNILQCIACSFFQLFQIWVYNQLGYFCYSLFVGLLGIACCANTLRFKFRENLRKDMMDLNKIVADGGHENHDFRLD